MRRALTGGLLSLERHGVNVIPKLCEPSNSPEELVRRASIINVADPEDMPAPDANPALAEKLTLTVAAGEIAPTLYPPAAIVVLPCVIQV
jgi:hypothetical protein